MAFMGVDIGTSGVKVIVCDAKGEVLETASHSLSVQNPQPMWSEQSPDKWWEALCSCLDTLANKGVTEQVTAIGLAGQMHGAVMLDAQHKVLHPAILWNDGRSNEQCVELTSKVEKVHDITGNMVMPGFTAPKLLWIKKHEPELFSKIHKVLLPKDYIRYLLTDLFVSDMSDAAGTSWLDVANRAWSEEMLAACGLSQAHMPSLCEGSEVTGLLKPELAKRWSMGPVPIVGGGGDNAAGAVGSGVVDDGQTILSLGTSGVLFSVTDKCLSNPLQALHCFCHALPEKWHVMSVHLSAASCLQWFADVAADGAVEVLLDEAQCADKNDYHAAYFLPYLSGERTPYNNPSMGGEFIGLSSSLSRGQMTLSILEGVAFAFKNGLEVMRGAGITSDEISIIGGGAKSALWRQLIADVLGVKIVFRAGGDVGPALGAAKLAQLATDPESTLENVCRPPNIIATHVPGKNKSAFFAYRFERFKQFSEQASHRRIWERVT
jgi:xylulokinase